MFRVWVFALGAVVLALANPSVPASASDTPHVDVAWVPDEDPGAATVLVANASPQPLARWEVVVPVNALVTDVSGAISIQDHDTVTLSSEEPLRPGQEAAVRLELLALGTVPQAPSWCSSPQTACQIIGTTREPTPTSTLSRDGVSLSYRVDRDWGTAQSVVVSMTNAGEEAVTDWTVEIPADVQVSDMWGAQSLSGEGAIRARSLPAEGYLAPGETFEFGFVVRPGRNQEWQECSAGAADSMVPCEVSAARTWAGYPLLPRQW